MQLIFLSRPSHQTLDIQREPFLIMHVYLGFINSHSKHTSQALCFKLSAMHPGNLVKTTALIPIHDRNLLSSDVRAIFLLHH